MDQRERLHRQSEELTQGLTVGNCVEQMRLISVVNYKIEVLTTKIEGRFIDERDNCISIAR
jgi:hypothetical protein